MAILPKIKSVKIKDKELKDFWLILHQDMLNHHLLQVWIRRDSLEKGSDKLFSGSENFIGEEIKFKIESNKNEKHSFTGIITEINITVTDNLGDTIKITAQSPDIILDGTEICYSFEEKKLDDIVNFVLDTYERKKRISSQHSTDSLPYVVNYNKNIYQFLTRLAIRFGEWFFYDGDTLYFGSMPEKTISLQCGTDLHSFDVSLKTINPYYNFGAHSYFKNDILKAKSSEQDVKIPERADITNKKSKELYPKHAAAIQFISNYLKETGEEKDLDNNAKLNEAAVVAGIVVCHGRTDNPNLSLGSKIEIIQEIDENNKKKKNKHGIYIIYNLSHHCDEDGNYENEFYALDADIEYPPYTNPLQNPLSDIESAIVKDNIDPEGLGRVRVQFYWQKDYDLETPWLRVITPHGGADKGFYFIPEIGEEVLVGFEGRNAEKPFVIGSLYHDKAKADSWKSDKNDIKAIRTRSGHTIEINDKDGGEEIKIYDYNKENYKIVLSTNHKKITIEAKEDIEIKAKNIKINADQKIEIKANDIEENAQKSLTLSGNQVEHSAQAKMKIDGGGQLEQSAGMIKIN